MTAAPPWTAPLREGAYLRRRYRSLLAATGTVLAATGAVTFLPLLVLVRHPEEAHHFLGRLEITVVLFSLVRIAGDLRRMAPARVRT